MKTILGNIVTLCKSCPYTSLTERVWFWKQCCDETTQDISKHVSLGKIAGGCSKINPVGKACVKRDLFSYFTTMN